MTFTVAPRQPAGWAEDFERWVEQNGILATIASSGMHGTGVHLTADQSAFEIAVGEVDKAIDYANDQYENVQLPLEREAAESAAKEKANQEQLQRELDQRAAKLARPGPDQAW
ncbi:MULTISPECIES: hypothetical protein [Actinomycetes]|uniref:hypothetical protein n=1 Tax=Actinomycetes TaxID=1760 RepID=UPI000AB2147B|nr:MULTISPECIES: hypothetical protein [Actinomycetes]